MSSRQKRLATVSAAQLRRSDLRFWLPAVGGMALAMAAMSLVRSIIDIQKAVLIAHAVVYCMSIVLLYVGQALLVKLAKHRTLLSIFTLLSASVFVGSWLAFYALLLGCVVAFREMPTLRLIEGYASQWTTLLAALPVEPVFLFAGLGLVVGLLTCLSWAVARCLEAFPENVALSVPTRTLILALSGVTAFLLGLAMRPAPAYADWLSGAHEPVTRALQNRPLMEESFSWANSYDDLARDAAAALKYSPTRSLTTNVIIIYVDALRADETQPYGASRQNMPFVSSLVENGVLEQVEWSMAACPSTICGLAALLQSRVAHRQHPRHFSLPLVLSRYGYRLAYILSSDHQSYFDLKAFYGGEVIDFYRDGRNAPSGRSNDDFVLLDALQTLGPAGSQPTFLMFGLVSPHTISFRNEQYEQYQPARVDLLTATASQVEVLRNHYHNGVMQADAVIGKLWGRLKDLGYLEDAIVVITGDHGESLGEHGVIGHSRSLYNSELRTPLWVFHSRSEEAPPSFLRQIDVAPLVLSRIGAPIPETWMGVANGSVEWSDHVFPADPSMAAVVRVEGGKLWKYMLWEGPSEAFYALHDDPGEKENLVAQVTSARLEPFRERARRLVDEMKASKRRVTD